MTSEVVIVPPTRSENEEEGQRDRDERILIEKKIHGFLDLLR